MQFLNEREAKAISGATSVFMMNVFGYGFVTRKRNSAEASKAYQLVQVGIVCQRRSRIMNMYKASHWIQNSQVMDLENGDVRGDSIKDAILDLILIKREKGCNIIINFNFSSDNQLFVLIFEILELWIIITKTYWTEISKFSCREYDCLWIMSMVLSDSKTDTSLGVSHHDWPEWLCGHRNLNHTQSFIKRPHRPFY